MNIDTFVGTVVTSAPDFGVALVYKSYTAPRLTDLVIAYLPHSDGKYGASAHAAFTSGTNVLCAMNPNSTHIAYIIGPANDRIDADLESTIGLLHYNVEKFTTGDSTTHIMVLDSLMEGMAAWFTNRAHGASRDAIAGDFDASDKQGLAGLHVGRLIAQLRGSAIAYIDVSGDTHKVRLVGDTIEHHTLMSETIDGPYYSAHNRAVTLSEAFGLKDGPIAEADDDASTLTPTSETTLPLYRSQHIAGPAVDGEEALVLEFPYDTDEHDSSTEPTMLSKRRTALSGELSQASALGVMSVKTPFIEGIHQLGYGQAPLQKDKPFEELREPFKYEEGQKKEEKKQPSVQEEIDDAALHKLIGTILSGDYLEAFKKKMAERGLLVSTKGNSLYGRMGEPDMPGGVSGSPAYALPESIVLTDPVTQESKEYYASMSFITQEPDGSILLCDGYGSEIRMSRGNIYISPALDLIARPGRDMSAMVPRHLSFNAQEHVTINSTKSIYVRASEDLKMVGATSGTGVVTVECMATSDGKAPSGLILRSNKNLSVTGKELYIGRNAHSTKDKNKTTQPATPGTIVIDAGSNGTITEHSKSHTVDAGEVLLGAFGKSNSAAISISQNNIGLYAQQILAPAQLLVSSMGSIPVFVFRDGKETTINIQTAASADKAVIVVEGSMLIGKNVLCNGGMQVNKGVTARGVNSISETNGVIDKPDRVFEAAEMPELTAPKDLGRNTAKSAYTASQGVYQDLYLTVNSFAFPETYSIATDLRMPGMVWQVRGEELGNTKVWEEKYVKDIDDKETACYPGYDVWEAANISVADYELKPLKDGYIVNI